MTGTIVAMTDTRASQPAPRDRHLADDIMSAPPAPRPSEWTVRDSVSLAVGAGQLAAVVGVVVGLVLAFGPTEVSCSIENGDGGCLAHPPAPVGIAVVVIALMLAILIGLVGAVAKAVLGDRRRKVQPSVVP